MSMLEGKVAVVTGGGRGIGREFAMLMAAHGAKVVVNDLGGSVSGEGTDLGPADSVVKEIQDAGGEAVANGDSVTDWDAAHRIVEQAIDSFGKVDIVVNNAGILRDVIFHKMTEDDFNSVIDVHLRGSFNISRAAAPYFRKQSSGAYIHMTSTSGLIGNFGQVNYGAAKIGIAGLSKCIALDMSRFRVRSNCITPFAWSRMIGTIPVNTPEEEERVERIKQMTPAKIAPMAVFLASDAAEDVTGQIFGVRMNEIYLFAQHRPVRAVHRAEGWTPELIAEHAIPTVKGNFMPLDRSGDVFSWDPI